MILKVSHTEGTPISRLDRAVSPDFSEGGAYQWHIGGRIVLIDLICRHTAGASIHR